MSRRDEGVIFSLGGKTYVWTRNTAGKLEAVSVTKVAAALQLVAGESNA